MEGRSNGVFPQPARLFRDGRARAYHSNIVIGELVVHSGQFVLWHVASNAIFATYRTSIPRALGGGLGVNIRHVASQALLII